MSSAAQPSLLARALMPLGGIILAAVAAAIYLFYLQSPAAKSTNARLAPPTAAPVGGAATPLPAVAQAPVAVAPSPATPVATPEPLAPTAAKPVGYKSNEELLTDLQAQGIKGLAPLLVREEFGRKLAIAVYGVSEGRVLSQNRPLLQPEGVFGVAKLTDEPDAQYRLLPQNAARYDLYVAAFAALNSDLGVTLYARAYPLLQAAFDELGMGRRSFHQVVILAIDNLLAAPDVTGDLVLVKPKLKYTYLDADIEKLPATHKLMLRLGAAHNQTVKQHLRGLRQKLVALNY